MTRLQIELPDDVAVEVKRRAEDSGLSVTSFVIGLVEREIGKGWPKWFFEEVVGGWQGEPPERPAHHNTEEFSRVTSLKLEDWEKPVG